MKGCVKPTFGLRLCAEAVSPDPIAKLVIIAVGRVIVNLVGALYKVIVMNLHFAIMMVVVSLNSQGVIFVLTIMPVNLDRVVGGRLVVNNGEIIIQIEPYLN